MDKVKRILEKAKELSEELRSITFEDYKGSYVEEMIFNNEVKEIGLEMLYIRDRIEALACYIEGEYCCGGCGKRFKPLDTTNNNDDYFCPECEEKLCVEMKLGEVLHLVYDDSIYVGDELKEA